jgi:hypothetical protein
MPEWVLAAYLGTAHTMSAPLSLVQPAAGTEITLASVDYRGQSFTPPFYYGSRLSYFPKPSSWMGIEAEFIHLKAYAETDGTTLAAGTHRGTPVRDHLPIGAVVERLSISHGLNLILVNGVLRRTLRRDRQGQMQLIGRIGAGPTIPHAESAIDGVAYEGYELGAVAAHAAIGLEIRMWRQLAALAEYKVTRTRQTLAIDRGDARGLFASHHGVFGIAWHSR